ncbi:MAG: hypothetical protein LQ346_006825, partial [Caloplaca aetnensis]
MSCFYAGSPPAYSTAPSSTPTVPLYPCKPVRNTPLPPHPLRKAHITDIRYIGNTMFLGLGTSNYNTTTRPYGWAKSLTSLICFVLGAIFFSRFAHYLQPSRRSTLTLSFLIQASIILLCAVLIQAGAIEGRLEYIGEDIDWVHTIPIALLSFQAPGQVWLSRDLNFAEVSTVV